jgi:hypothetical protein
VAQDVKDIREVPPEEHWEHFEKAWTALMSYRYFGKQSPDLDADTERETMPLRSDMRTPAGGILASPLCIAAVEPYWSDTECVPAPVVMSYEILDQARDVTQVDVLRDVIHLGRNLGFSRSRVVDARDHSRVIAVSMGMGVSLGDVPDGYERVANPSIDVEDSPRLPALAVAFGAVRGDDGLWRLPPLKPELSAPHAALHQGPINIVCEAAAWDAVVAHAGTDQLDVDSYSVMFVRPGIVGPFRAEGEVTSGGAQRIAVQVTLYDEGRGDRVISVAQEIFRRA